MSGLSDYIRELIEKNGPLSIARYMELALQHPEYGYYRHHDPLGKSGDFITAPEISQMFGEMIGLWWADVWHQIDSPSEFILLELGPGRGTLLEDALRATIKIKGLHQAMRLYLLESSTALRSMQSDRLKSHRPKHIDSLSNLPELPTIVLANEFFDALPVRQFEKTAHGWCERLVAVEANRFVFTLSAPDPAFLMMIPEERREVNVGAIYEFSMASLSLIRTLASHISRFGGAALIIDYGYAAFAGQGTLQALAGHNFVDVLSRPGEIDITAHVDFHALKQIASANEVRVFGPLGQGEFLKSLGIEVRAIQLKHTASQEHSKEIDQALHRLTDPSQMGSLFKTLGIASQKQETMAGF